jgi:hypothetical protein
VKNFYTGGGEKFMGRGEKNSYVKTLKPLKKKTYIYHGCRLPGLSQKNKTREPKKQN